MRELTQKKGQMYRRLLHTVKRISGSNTERANYGNKEKGAIKRNKRRVEKERGLCVGNTYFKH